VESGRYDLLDGTVEDSNLNMSVVHIKLIS
jgi:hypothetical protein